MSKLHTLRHEYGQSIWLDYIDRSLLVRGGLKVLVNDGVRGVTSNPTIFNKAINASADYDDAIRDLIHADHGIDDETLYQWLSIQDVQMAADILKHVYDSSEGTDGFVSLEVSPHLAYDTDATIEAGRHLWHKVNRPNLMIKVPATVQGLGAIEALISENINVNATLLFSVERYKQVTEAFLRGLASNPEPQNVASVASFFVSRVDAWVDAALDEIGSPKARSLQGRIAIANVIMAYTYFKEMMRAPSFEALRQRGAKPQRPLWASTGTKNPEYSDVLYVEQLIGPETINTVTPETLDAFQAHGELRATLDVDIEGAQRALEALSELGIDLQQITEELEQDGVKQFAASHDQLIESLQQRRYTVAAAYAG
jgi:transaldolase